MATVQWCLHKLDFKRQLFCALQVTKPPWYITSIFWCWSRDQVIWEGCDMNGIRYKISEESLSICLPSVCCSRNIVCWHGPVSGLEDTIDMGWEGEQYLPGTINRIVIFFRYVGQMSKGLQRNVLDYWSWLFCCDAGSSGLSWREGCEMSSLSFVSFCYKL